ncbi:MAG: GTPase Era [Bacteroidetes bacterium GWF2_38_335]|nr:MAG: GTPase Era [Bacteroidetes bacterium GWF2_38_335]OFY80796.1 MAG: GTPase Era [Bacteroidetes bacterium RIFOXYA12_FULL_38_20]HBS86195.1 GTPase Era [Bacteroidales bacterium]
MTHKAGFVNILGNPNVGKSTLMNALVGEKLSIITSKAQTTRHRIMGIVNGEDFQIVYSDTPGILKPAYKLQESMMKFVSLAMRDADIILYLTDIYETPDKNMNYISKLQKTKIPVILLINKIDQSNQDQLAALVEMWHGILPDSEILPISALKKFNVEPLLKKVTSMLPESEPFFPKDQLTDKSQRFFIEEMIREKILLHYSKEIPYSVEVETEDFIEEEKIIRIRTIIFVMRDSQKGIIIGHKGEKLKKVGTEARKDAEDFFGKKVFLEIIVRVNKDWRDDKKQLKRYGYEV